jgi:hypothetical protein
MRIVIYDHPYSIRERYHSMMINSIKRSMWGALCAFFMFNLIQGTSWTYNKKLEITTEKANVFLKPDIHSSKIGLLKKGDTVTLASPIKIKKSWYYIYFNAGESDLTSSGYILEASVRKLFSITKVISIDKGENQKNRHEYGVHFRNARWGMNQNQVIFTEGSPLSRETSGKSATLKYKTKFMDLDCLLIYKFFENNLIAAKYNFPNKNTGKPIHIEDYNSVKTALIQKYGLPQNKKSCENSSSDENHSISDSDSTNLHDFLQTSCWETAKTRICLYLYQSKKNLEMELEYTRNNSNHFSL